MKHFSARLRRAEKGGDGGSRPRPPPSRGSSAPVTRSQAGAKLPPVRAVQGCSKASFSK